MHAPYVLATVICCLTLAVSGCGDSEKKRIPSGDIATSEAQIVTVPPPTPKTAQPFETPNALSGSTWKVGEFEIQFRDNTRLLVKGGELGNLNPSGVEGRYTLKDGVLEISVMGQSRKGTFDDKGLIMEGAVGEKVK